MQLFQRLSRRVRIVALLGTLGMLGGVMLAWSGHEERVCQARQAQVLRQDLYRQVPERADDAAARYCARNGNQVTDPAAKLRALYGPPASS